jgi:head-tail adaptor
MSGFAGSLRERIRIERPGTQRDLEGRLHPGWYEAAACFAAVAPDGTGSDVQGMALSAMPRFEIRLRTIEAAEVGNRIVWKGRRLLIRQRVDDPRQPGRLVLKCEEMR